MTVGSRVQFGLLKGAAAMTKPLRYRGLHRVAWALGSLFSSNNRVQVDRFEGRLWLYLADGYWIRLLRRDWTYEPEVRHALQRLLETDSYFIDGGANIGYWSLFASSIVGSDAVVAIEASPQNYERLVENATLNRNGWNCVHAALWSTSGEEIVMYSGANLHASGTVVSDLAPPSPSSSTVTTTAIDDVVERFAPDNSRPLVLKLDVEGAEIEAIRGAKRTMSSRAISIVYEDHGKDATHKVTKFMMEELGLRVCSISPDGTLLSVTDLAQLDKLKRSEVVGYNFIATNL